MVIKRNDITVRVFLSREMTVFEDKSDIYAFLSGRGNEREHQLTLLLQFVHTITMNVEQEWQTLEIII